MNLLQEFRGATPSLLAAISNTNLAALIGALVIFVAIVVIFSSSPAISDCGFSPF
ncbi:hypothetical protein RSSM_03070 [Rhodopirellula sallentina SM41]|uniref:Uncharacterized protein n=1 Tax=Rhodopirellula sallentina SM41 TaxID=1263870 RepID=M5UCC2_9BACT|nr:hypothetical protein RSSM_03070 [Rhodopirellula sallentina SM41]